MTASRPRLVLASASPRRAELLRQAGFDFVIHPSNVDEDDFPAGLLPTNLASFLAEQKARAVSKEFPEDAVLGADTVVAFGDKSLGKPADAKEARDMLELLSCTTHLVITGVAVNCIASDFLRRSRVMSAVRMRYLTAEEIERYVASDLWRGKAGGYGIQDQDPFVVRTAGCHTNIVGLPMKLTASLLKEAGIVASSPPTT